MSQYRVGLQNAQSAGLVLACGTASERPLGVGLLEGAHLTVHAGTEIHGRWHCHQLWSEAEVGVSSWPCLGSGFLRLHCSVRLHLACTVAGLAAKPGDPIGV